MIKRYFRTSKSFRFSRRNFSRKFSPKSPQTSFQYIVTIVSNRFYSRLVIQLLYIQLFLLCFNFSHENISILRAADLKYTLMSSRTRAFFFLPPPPPPKTKILCERSNSSKTIFGNKETKEMIKRQPWKFLMAENGCVHERIESF